MSQGIGNRVAIIGQGYVGLPLSIAAVKAGWCVFGIDSAVERVDLLNSGISPVGDITNDILVSALNSGSYVVSNEFEHVSKVSTVILCVPTPLTNSRSPDLSLLENAVKSISPFLQPGTLLITESTSYPGTLRDFIKPTVERINPYLKNQILFAAAPERVNPGDKSWNQKNTPRLVGGLDLESEKKANDFYSMICDEVVKVSSPEIAEAAKLLENTFRLVNIALVNEFAQIFSNAGIDVNEIINAAATKPYGFMPFRPGVGVGGHCIPIDPLYLTWWAHRRGSDSRLIEAADQVNREMPLFVAKKAMEIVNSKSPRILILGVAYKPGVGDVRETPVTELCSELLIQGADVGWFDPFVENWDHGIKKVELDWECDIAILATAHPGVDLAALLNRGVPILDCTNSLKNQENIYSLSD